MKRVKKNAVPSETDEIKTEKEKTVEKNIIYRGFATAAAILLYGWVNFLLTPVSTILTGQVAGKQFENSDISYVTSVVGMRFLGDLGIPFIVLLIVFAAIWWQYIRMIWTTALVVIAVSLIGGTPAQAYYDKQDWAEVYFILPNESAFYIPDVGANKTSQAKFGSEEYLRENKIAAKRFNIPHVKLENSGMFSNYYVPAGRLIIVDRTPYNREWVASAERGTSKTNEGLVCQSNEGLDITAGIAIGTSVLEENAPRFLYRFGVKPPVGDRSKPEVIFASVFNARSLKEVMDGVVRTKVQALTCQEVSKRSLDDANSQAPQIMAAVEKSVNTYLQSVGITLDFIGWADTFTFDPVVQRALNDRYAAEKIRPVLQVLETKAKIDTMQKWDGKLPWWMPTGLGEIFQNIFGGVAKAPTTAPAPAPQAQAPKKQ